MAYTDILKDSETFIVFDGDVYCCPQGERQGPSASCFVYRSFSLFGYKKAFRSSKPQHEQSISFERQTSANHIVYFTRLRPIRSLPHVRLFSFSSMFEKKLNFPPRVLVTVFRIGNGFPNLRGSLNKQALSNTETR